MGKWIRATLLSSAVALAGVAVASSDKDWRSQGSTDEKLEQLLKTLPSTAQIMLEMGERYQNLYWSAKLGQWAFAEYQLEEMEKLIELLQVSRPKYAESAQLFLDKGLAGFEESIKTEEWPAFQTAFQNMRAQCILCHNTNDHGFIVPPESPVTANSVILNLPPEGRAQKVE